MKYRILTLGIWKVLNIDPWNLRSIQYWPLEFMKYSILTLGIYEVLNIDLWRTEMISFNTPESRIIGGVGIIGGVDIVIIINNRGVGQGWKNSVGGFLVFIC